MKLDARAQLLHVERLVHVVVRARLEPGQLRFHFLPGGEQQNRHLGRGILVVGASREQVLAGVLARLVLGTADPELLRAEKLCVGGTWCGVGEARHAVRAHAVGEGDQLGVR